MLRKAIGESESTLLRVNLIGAIASGKDSGTHLKALAAGKGVAGGPGRLPLGRVGGGGGSPQSRRPTLSVCVSGLN